MSLRFTYALLTAPDQDTAQQAARLSAAARAGGVQVWGLWGGLFGLSARQFVLLTVGENASTDWLAEGFAIDRQEVLEATARPTESQPLTRDGVLRGVVLRKKQRHAELLNQNMKQSHQLKLTVEDVKS